MVSRLIQEQPTHTKILLLQSSLVTITQIRARISCFAPNTKTSSKDPHHFANIKSIFQKYRRRFLSSAVIYLEFPSPTFTFARTHSWQQSQAMRSRQTDKPILLVYKTRTSRRYGGWSINLHTRSQKMKTETVQKISWFFCIFSPTTCSSIAGSILLCFQNFPSVLQTFPTRAWPC